LRSNLFVLVAALGLLGGCQAAKVAEPLTAELAGNDPQSRVAFWHTLAERPVVSNDEAWHGLLLLVDDQDPAEDYAGRVEQLKSRDMLPAGFDRPADEAVRRGDLAIAICRILKINGGVIMRIIGPIPRYATRELVYREIYQISSPQQTFSGTQFLAVIGRVEDLQPVSAVKTETEPIPPSVETTEPATEPGKVEPPVEEQETVDQS